MKFTPQPMTVEDHLGRKHVRGVGVTQELFEADMLNRTLFALFQQKPTDKSTDLMDDWLIKAQEPPYEYGSNFTFDAKTMAAFQQCKATGNTIAAASLLRIARREEVILATIRTHFGGAIQDEATQIQKSYTADNFTVALHINGIAAETGRKIFALTAEEILQEQPDFYWYGAEYLNLPYMVENNLLNVAQLVIAKCHAVKALEKLIDDKLLEDNYLRLSNDIRQQLEDWRYRYLKWQISSTFITLTGCANTQHGGMSYPEACDYARSTIDRTIKRSA